MLALLLQGGCLADATAESWEEPIGWDTAELGHVDDALESDQADEDEYATDETGGGLTPPEVEGSIFPGDAVLYGSPDGKVDPHPDPWAPPESTVRSPDR
jgi:hypothetical protein